MKNKIKKLPSKEIRDLKSSNFWLIRDLWLCNKHVNDENNSIIHLNSMMDNINPFTRIYKELFKNRNKHLDKLGLLIDLDVRIREDIYNNGKEIMRLRNIRNGR